ncbi:MAG: ATP-dependent protease subunit HslV [Deltaproteobacteria bacterium]|nr:ATP-dependent protease subunit HslV [Deltaproteobacteria bacterium]
MVDQTNSMHATTIVAVRRDGRVAFAGDGQVTLGEQVIKHHAKKIRRLHDDKVVVGFAGAVADAFNLFEKLEQKLDAYSGNLLRAAVELAKDWRRDKYLRQLNALLIAADKDETLVISGGGEVIQPDDGVAAIGSGGSYALAAARALLRHTEMPAREIAETAMGIAAEICIFTNDQIVADELGAGTEQ